jgi:F-type H+-transporting ATPase subunit epsilon
VDIPSKLRLQVVSVDRMLVDQMVDEIEIPGSEGYFGVLPGHAPLLALIGVGELWYRVGQGTIRMLVANGFAEVLPDRVTVLTQIAERPEEIDVARAEAAKRRAEERMYSTPMVEIDYERARIALMKSLMRLQIAARPETRS